MRTIVIQWIDTTTNIPNGFNPTEMKVIYSQHPIIKAGTTFNDDLFTQATKERYTIIFLPVDSSDYEEQLKNDIIKGILNDPNYNK